MGRKSKLSIVFDFIRQGCSLYAACVKAGLSTREFYQMLAQTQDLRDDFLLALSDYADQCTDDIRALAQALKTGDIDNSTAKLLIETEKWLALKACPEAFKGFDDMENGDKKESAEIVVKFI